ncbi:MAG: LamG-like jellyroll fold domain-containing protein [Bacteroidota bacterium]
MRKISTFLIATFSTLLSFSQTIGLDFDGTNDYLAIAEKTNVLTGNNFTFEAWVKPSNLTNFNSVINKGTAGNYFLVKLNGEDPDMGTQARINVFMSNGTTNGQIFYNISMAWINQWHHLAVTYNGSTITLYVDGISVATSSWTGSIPSNAGYLRLGSSYGNNLLYAGTLDEVRIWNIVRTPAEISANMNTEISAGSTGLVAYYRLNDGTVNGNNTSVSSAADLATSPGNATLTNFAKTGSTSNFTTGIVSMMVLALNDASFKAIKKDGTVLLSWKEQPDQFSFSYEIERSTNKVDFLKIGTVWGNAAATSYNYTFIDAQPAEVNYYRIRSVGSDGLATYSKIIAVIINNSSRTLQIYPNPVQSTLNLRINVRKGVVKVQIKDIAGKTLQSVQLQSEGTMLFTSLDVSRLATGSYLVIANSESIHFVKK